jgi:hypothetical protein
VREQQLLTLELFEDATQCDLLVLNDVATVGTEGMLDEREVVPGSAGMGALGRDMSPEQFLALLRAFTGKAPRCVLLSTLALSLELGEGPTAPVEALVPVALERVLAIVGA